MEESDRAGKRILAVLDDADTAARVIEWTIDELGPDRRGFVDAVHVVSPTSAFLRDCSADGLTSWRVQLRSEMQAHWIKPLREAGIEHATPLVEGHTVVDGILWVAEQEDLDLIVTSVHHHLTGATSHRLLRLAPAPVVVLPPAWHPAAELAVN